jgi:hypothetical protein
VNLEAVASAIRVPPDATLYTQIDGLSAAHLVGVRQNSGPPIPPSQTFGGASWGPSRLIQASLMPTGRVLHDLMELEALPRADLDAIHLGLRGDRDP